MAVVPLKGLQALGKTFPHTAPVFSIRGSHFVPAILSVKVKRGGFFMAVILVDNWTIVCSQGTLVSKYLKIVLLVVDCRKLCIYPQIWDFVVHAVLFCLILKSEDLYVNSCLSRAAVLCLCRCESKRACVSVCACECVSVRTVPLKTEPPCVCAGMFSSAVHPSGLINSGKSFWKGWTPSWSC